MRKLSALLLAALLCLAPLSVALADAGESEGYFTLYDTAGTRLCRIKCDVSVDDEYIASDNRVYRVSSVDDAALTAVAEYVADEPVPLLKASAGAASSNKTVCLYCTHSDESYEPTDGTSSDEERGGIYDVAGWLAEGLQNKGVNAVLDESTHFPHDSGAYDRSRSTASRLLQDFPAAMFDIHRDGVPADEYDTELNGQAATKVRLLVGRSNPNSQANRSFADLIKAVADEKYPGLIKDIFVGKGNYNQELAPNSVLLEFGTHESDKEAVRVSVDAMADVLTQAVFGGAEVSSSEPAGATEGASATGGAGSTSAPQPTSEGVGEAQKKTEKARGMSAVWWIVLGVGLLVVFALAITGSFAKIWHHIKRTGSEVTVGTVGEKPDKDDQDPEDGLPKQ